MFSFFGITSFSASSELHDAFLGAPCLLSVASISLTPPRLLFLSPGQVPLIWHHLLLSAKQVPS